MRWEEKNTSKKLIEEDARSNIKTEFEDVHAMRSVHTVHVLQSIKREQEMSRVLKNWRKGVRCCYE